MKRNALLIPFIIFLIIAAALLWQLARNAQGDDPTNLESALIGKPVPTFRPSRWKIRVSIIRQMC